VFQEKKKVKLAMRPNHPHLRKETHRRKEIYQRKETHPKKWMKIWKMKKIWMILIWKVWMTLIWERKKKMMMTTMMMTKMKMVNHQKSQNKLLKVVVCLLGVACQLEREEEAWLLLGEVCRVVKEAVACHLAEE